MNIFKGLLFLHGHINPADVDDFIGTESRQHYGAGTAAEEIAPPLGNRAASRKWLGREASAVGRLPEVGCITGGCG